MDLDDKASVIKVQKKIIEWGKKNIRYYPWRTTKDPYAVLLAEILLHRTNADQVVPVYNMLLQNYPTVSELAEANSEVVTEIMKPLGLFWRIPLLIEMAKTINSQFNSKIPESIQYLNLLPGVGPYISSATINFAFQQPSILLDTNTVRILGRLTGTPISDSSRRSNLYKSMMWKFIDESQSKLFNLSLLDLGALICVSRHPLCTKCPVFSECTYYNTSGI